MDSDLFDIAVYYAYSFPLPDTSREPASCVARYRSTVGAPRLVTLVTDHDDTAELYRMALERADFVTARCRTVDEAVEACRATAPIAIVVHFAPRHDPATVGSVLRAGNPGSVLIGLFSIQLSLSTLKHVLDNFD